MLMKYWKNYNFSFSTMPLLYGVYNNVNDVGQISNPISIERKMSCESVWTLELVRKKKNGVTKLKTIEQT